MAISPFVSNVKKMDKVDGPDADKSEQIKSDFFLVQFCIFKDAGSQRIGSSD
jgi:hypothetical protein